MEFPVDLLRDTSHEDLESCAEEYMSELADRDLDQLEYFTQPNNEMVVVSISSVGFVPLYGSDEACKVLALFTSENPFSAVALYLVDQWWAVEDILKTSDNFRNGLIQECKKEQERILHSMDGLM
ncbi:soluble lamin-associated protein of 75 kDa-like [Protopterus annectens]|uniref:soluble lamin-associated protein of 75 kDa-like n=1 Tax=Protopterus annectens TaxID=7888 RepID=UPI001CFA9ADE|nr:soluble lamin-associated protein of 75 kDa-like [Protopterus annectens]